MPRPCSWIVRTVLALLLLLLSAQPSSVAAAATAAAAAAAPPWHAKAVCDVYVHDLPVPISRVHLKLFTQDGALQETLLGEPTLAYYVVPLYDTRNYTLVLTAPTGWSFDRTHADVSSTSSLCTGSSNITFTFRGFAVTGALVVPFSGSPPSPLIATVEALPEAPPLAQDSDDNLPAVTTTATGRDDVFELGQLPPGTYRIRPSHPHLVFTPPSRTVTVADDNVRLGAFAFAVSCVRLRGSVLASLAAPSPLANVPVFIVLHNGTKAPPSTLTDSTGHYAFELCLDHLPLLASSIDATLFASDAMLVHRIVPSSVSSLTVPPLVDGAIAVTGRVLHGDGTTGVPGAVVRLGGPNDEPVAVTNYDGCFAIRVQEGTKDTVVVSADGVRFAKVHVVFPAVQPEPFVLRDIVASSYLVTGQMLLDEPADEDAAPSLTVQGMGSAAFPVVHTQGPDAKFSFWVPPGTYELAPIADVKGPQISPEKMAVTVLDKPVTGLAFGRSMSSVSGTIQCIRPPCGVSIEVTLAKVDVGQFRRNTHTLFDDSFLFSHVLPGRYIVSVNQDTFCFGRHLVEVASTDESKDIVFGQTGYAVNVIAPAGSHFNVTVSPLGKGKAAIVHELHGGSNTICVPTKGKYELTTPQGPFAMVAGYDTDDNPTAVHLHTQATPHHEPRHPLENATNILISARDASDRALANVVIKTTGPPSFETAANYTDRNGNLALRNVAPGDYSFVPYLKEYKIEPSKVSATITKGQTLKVAFKGTRVAYSLFGRVETVAKDPVGDAIVRATSLSFALDDTEEAVSDMHGNFRILGLKPGNTYNVMLQPCHAVRLGTPAGGFNVTVRAADIGGIFFEALARSPLVDITGHFKSPGGSEFNAHELAGFTIELVRGNGKVIRSIDVGETPFFEFPSCVQEEGYTVRLHSPQTQLVLNKAFAVDSTTWSVEIPLSAVLPKQAELSDDAKAMWSFITNVDYVSATSSAGGSLVALLVLAIAGYIALNVDVRKALVPTSPTATTATATKKTKRHH